jgi:hypothetical protein
MEVGRVSTVVFGRGRSEHARRDKPVAKIIPRVNADLFISLSPRIRLLALAILSHNNFMIPEKVHNSLSHAVNFS